MITVRCKECDKELTSDSGRPQSCGCPNMTTVSGEVVSALDLTKVIMINSGEVKNKSQGLSSKDLQWQEQRRKRKVRKLDFEIR